MALKVYIIQLEKVDGTCYKVNGITVDEERITFQSGEDCNIESLEAKINELYFPAEKNRPLGRIKVYSSAAASAASLQTTKWVCHDQLPETLEDGKHYGFIDLVGLEQQQLQQQQQANYNLLDRMMPVINAFPVVLEEVRQSRRSRLNCWERESARTTGSKRDPKFRQKVISYYKRKSASGKNVRCQILDELTPVDKAQGTIIAAHVWKASTRGQRLDEFGLRAEDVNNPRNGMFLTKGFADAFDRQQVCFLYNLFESTLVLWIADTSIMSRTIEGSTKTFSDVHRKPLLCPPGHRPYRRLLSWHARLTLELWKQTLQVEHYTSEYDNSPGREHAVKDPISRAISEMVRPGDDASVSDE